MIVHNLLGGGGGEKAEIFVVSEQSNTITCTSPSGKALSGVWGNKTVDNVSLYGKTFQTSEYGTHTVTATSGTKTVTNTVLVDAVATFVVDKPFRQYLYRDGNEYTSITGGWRLGATSGGTVTKASDHINYTTTTSKYASNVTTDEIDITNFSTFGATIYTNSFSSGALVSMRICSNADGDGGNVLSGSNLSISSGEKTYTISVASVSGEYYVSVQFNGIMNSDIRAVYLE